MVDARGLLCPIPVIRLTERIEEAAPGGTLVLLADDPAAEDDVRLWCRGRGHELVDVVVAGPGDAGFAWSPYSVASALGLTAAGARGRTRDELVAALAPDGDIDRLAASLAAGGSLEQAPDAAARLAVAHPLRPGLAALVVGRGVVVRAVAAHVEVGPAGRAGLPEADPLAGGEVDAGSAGEAPHERRLRQRLPRRNRLVGTPFSFRGCDPINGTMADRPRPLYSSHAEDPSLAEGIDRFVLELAETVDTLQDAHSAGDCALLGRLAKALASDADRLGYAPLARLAEEVAGCAEQEKHEAARRLLLEVTAMAQRIRMGHRGAL